jgi:hypothetical protein
VDGLAAPDVPAGLYAHHLYTAPTGDPPARIAFVFDRRRLAVGRVLLYAGVAGTLVAILLDHVLVALAAALVAVGGRLSVYVGGRTGYYVLRPDGTLGKRLERAEVNLAGWHRG